MTDATRFARHLALEEIGADGQARLEASRVLIVGLGGLGCPAALYLAGAGVGRLVLNDFDEVDLSNLPRQILFGDEDIGSLKVDAAAAALRRINGGVAIETLADRLDEQALTEAVAGVDIVLDCTDNFGARLAINHVAVAAGKPLISGAALRLEGQIAVFSNSGAGPCYRCVYSEEDELLGSCEGNGVLAPVPGVIGCLMAVETLKLVALGSSANDGVLKLWDSVSAEWQTVRLSHDPECPVCSGP